MSAASVSVKRSGLPARAALRHNAGRTGRGSAWAGHAGRADASPAQAPASEDAARPASPAAGRHELSLAAGEARRILLSSDAGASDQGRRRRGLVRQDDHHGRHPDHAGAAAAGPSGAAARHDLCQPRAGPAARPALAAPRGLRGGDRRPWPDGALRSDAAARHRGRDLDRQRASPQPRHPRSAPATRRPGCWRASARAGSPSSTATIRR